MKITYWLVTIAALALPAAGSPSTFDMTFTGGVYLNLNGNVVPLAPESGLFTYDPQVGFTNFIVRYQSESFDLTASANAPLVCNASGLNCSAGNAATALNLLAENATWYSFETYSGGTVVTELSLSGAISATAPVFPGFSVGDLPRSGTFTVPVAPVTRDPRPITGDPTPIIGDPTPVTGDPAPDAAVPEPGMLRLLSLSGFALWCSKRLKRLAPKVLSQQP